MTSNDTRYWIRSLTGPPGVILSVSPPVTPDAMRPEYDLTGGVRGKYYARYRKRDDLPLSRWRQVIEYLKALYR